MLENLFFPSICQGCGKPGTYLCKKCVKKKIIFIKEQHCHVCKKKIKKGFVHKKCRCLTHLDGVFVTARYSKFVERFLADIKYGFYYAMIEDVNRIMIHPNSAEATSGRDSRSKIWMESIGKNSVFTFVPLHPSRRRWRGFNQAEEMAKGIGKYWDIPVVKLLERRRKTKSQVGLDKKMRRSNLLGAFEVSRQLSAVSYQNVILVDDVMTTGGTLEECARVLKKSGVKKVWGLVFARG